MRGYLSFVLVFSSVMLIITLILVFQASVSADYSKAVSVERAYAIQMNAKEAVLESVRYGSLGGFRLYDSGHEVSKCKHCPDHFCIPPTPPDPAPPNVCDETMCSACFRESEARVAAQDGAGASVSLLRQHQSDPQFPVSLGELDIEASLKADALSKNGFSLGSMRFRKGLGISVDAGAFGIRGESGIPEGMVVSFDGG